MIFNIIYGADIFIIDIGESCHML